MAQANQRPRPRKPPKINPAAELAQKLLAVLESQHAAGGQAYPLTLEQAARQADSQADVKTVLSAVGRKEFKAQAIAAKTKAGKFTAEQAFQSPVALLDDVDQLAAMPATLELALRCKRNAKVQAFSVASLAPALGAKLRPVFKEVWNRRVETGELPSTIGFVRINGAKLFFLEDLHPAPVCRPPVAHGVPPAAPPKPAPRTPPPVSADPSPADFASRFDEAFRQIDYRKGGHNFVSLVDLRQMLGDLPRGAFDAGLRTLRLAGRYTLSAAESVQGIQPEQRMAGIEEAGSLLLYVSRKGG
jgi:hypothetical protein